MIGASAGSLAAEMPGDEIFVAPASFAQQRLWIVERRSPELATYTLSIAWRIAGALDVPALAHAVDALVARHETLRTTLALRDGMLCQLVAMRHTGVLTFAEADPGADPDEAIALLVRRDSGRSLDLERGPCFVANLVSFRPDLHLLTLALHHAMGDEESLSILAGELWHLYRARIGAQAEALPRLDLQYADFAAWQKARLSSEACEASLLHWETKLTGAPALLDLPLAAPDTPAAAGDWVDVELDEEDSRWLALLAEQNGASLFMVSAAFLQLLLHRITGLGDFLLGYPSTGRDRPELEGVVGMFVNMLVLRAQINGGEDIARLVRSVRDRVLEGQEHKDVPFEMVVERLASDRRHGRNPLFQVACAFGTTRLNQAREENPRLQLVPAPRSTSKFDLTLYLTRTAGRFHGGFEFDAARFDRAAVELLAERLSQLVASARRMPECPIDRLPAIPEREQAMLSAFAATMPAPAHFRSIPDFVAEHVRLRPDALALRCGEIRLTYRQLADAAAAVQAALAAAGVSPGEPVGILIGASTQMVTAMLATLSAGAAYVPLDPSLPEARLCQLVDGLRIRRFVTIRGAVHACLRDAATVIDVEDCDPAASSPMPPIAPSQPCYFIHTSGSSGTPKPVAVPHAGLSALVTWHADHHGLRPGLIASQLASPSFDACGWEIWSCLANGGTLAILPAEARSDPVALLDALTRADVEQAFMPTPLAQAFLALLERSDAPPRLRRLLTGGDRLASPPPRQRGFTVHNHYGPTEATVVATAGAVRADGSTPDIGKPIAGTLVRLLDRRRDLVPVGSAGEICIAGAGVALGYWGRPRETALAFAPDPFADTPGERIYSSGDLARFRLDGTLDFLGRLDDQLKRNGVRIEPAEIEAALMGIEDVRGAAVALVQDDPASPGRLVAIVESGADGALPSDLRERLATVLPTPMLPDIFVSTATLPLLPNGKLDRAATRALARDAVAAPRDAGSEPRTALETDLARIWCELLGAESAGPADNFFALGGHSMLAIQLAARIRDRHGVEIDIAQLFERPLLSQQHDYLAGLLDQGQAETAGEGMESGVL